MNFYKLFANFIDVQSYYSEVCLEKKATILDAEICKGEQMSNWEKRPLRLS